MRGRKHIWTPKEEKILIESYGVRLMTDFCSELGVSISSAKRKLKEMGISRKTNKDCFQNPQFMKAYSRKIKASIQESEKSQAKKGRIHEGSRKTLFQKGHKWGAETQKKVTSNIIKARRKQNYEELLRLKYGLPQETKLRLKKKLNLRKEDYISED